MGIAAENHEKWSQAASGMPFPCVTHQFMLDAKPRWSNSASPSNNCDYPVLKWVWGGNKLNSWIFANQKLLDFWGWVKIEIASGNQTWLENPRTKWGRAGKNIELPPLMTLEENYFNPTIRSIINHIKQELYALICMNYIYDFPTCDIAYIYIMMSYNLFILYIIYIL